MLATRLVIKSSQVATTVEKGVDICYKFKFIFFNLSLFCVYPTPCVSYSPRIPDEATVSPSNVYLRVRVLCKKRLNYGRSASSDSQVCG